RGGLPDEERALQVHAQHAIEVGFGEVEEVRGMDDAGVVDENVEVAEGAAGVCDHALGALGVADVGSEEARVAERASGGLTGGGLDIGDGDLRAFGEVAPGDREPDAARAAGHDGNLVLEPHARLRRSAEGSTRNAISVSRTRCSTLLQHSVKNQRRPNRRSRNHPSRPRSIGWGLTACPPTGVLTCPSAGAPCKAAFGIAEANEGALVSPGNAATATP